jgi:hypothetical protein
MVLVLAACGGGSEPVALSAIPGPEGGTELDPNIAKTLANNNATDALLRAQLGSGGKTEQKGYDLPADADWNAIKSFYDGRLKGDGWGTNGTLTAALETANASNPLFKIANWQKGDQNVNVIMIADPTDEAKKNLVISLTTN